MTPTTPIDVNVEARKSLDALKYFFTASKLEILENSHDSVLARRETESYSIIPRL